MWSGPRARIVAPSSDTTSWSTLPSVVTQLAPAEGGARGPLWVR